MWLLTSYPFSQQESHFRKLLLLMVILSLAEHLRNFFPLCECKWLYGEAENSVLLKVFVMPQSHLQKSLA